MVALTMNKCNQIVNNLSYNISKGITIKIKNSIILFSLLLLYGCSHKEPLASYKKDSILIKYQSSKNLNQYKNASHSLVLRVYQLRSIKKFKEIYAQEKGIKQLMLGDNLDNSFITSSKYIIIPNKQGMITIDRFEETRFIAVVAGFYKYKHKNNIILISPIPRNNNYLGLTSSSYKNLKLNIKINKDSIHNEQKNNPLIKNRDTINKEIIHDYE